MRDYYKVLGVSKNATSTEIKTAYRVLARQYHPDYNRDNKVAEEMLKMINEAYSVLSSQPERTAYDRTHSQAEAHDPLSLQSQHGVGEEPSNPPLKEKMSGSYSFKLKFLQIVKYMPRGKIISLAMGCGYIFFALFFVPFNIHSLNGFGDKLSVILGAVIAVAFIWFGDEIGANTGPNNFDVPTPGFMIRFVGWLLLIGPLVVFLFNVF